MGANLAESIAAHAALLWRPHDHPRDLRAPLLPAHASDKREQDRHVITMSVPSRPHNVLRRSSTRPVGARSNAQFGYQLLG